MIELYDVVEVCKYTKNIVIPRWNVFIKHWYFLVVLLYFCRFFRSYKQVLHSILNVSLNK